MADDPLDDIPKHVATKPEPRPELNWWMPRHKEKTEKMKQQEVDLLMIGDSITHGWEGRGKDIWNARYSGRNPLNLGFSGDRTEHVLWRLQNAPLDAISPEVAVLMIGTNNVGHGSSTPRQAADGILAIVKLLRAQYPEMEVLVLHVFPRGATPNDPLRKKVKEINGYLPEMLDEIEKVTLLNINETFLKEDGTLPKSIMPDLLHPNEKGYALWGEAMEPTLRRLLDEEKNENK
jgi:beta-glucosidase